MFSGVSSPVALRGRRKREEDVMPKEFVGLQKRLTPQPAYAASGPKLANFGPLRVNDVVSVRKEGESISIRIQNIEDPQYLTGKVEKMLHLEIDGVKVGSDVKVPRECVFVVEERN
jgi:hypothetical protein